MKTKPAFGWGIKTGTNPPYLRTMIFYEKRQAIEQPRFIPWKRRAVKVALIPIAEYKKYIRLTKLHENKN